MLVAQKPAIISELYTKGWNGRIKPENGEILIFHDTTVMMALSLYKKNGINLLLVWFGASLSLLP